MNSAYLNSANSGFFVNPVRSSTYTNVLGYNPGTSEILYSAKTFVIDHPIYDNRYLVHACLEGPSSGVYYHGKARILENNNSIKIELPLYCNAWFNFNIQLTSIADRYCEIKNQYNTTEVTTNDDYSFPPHFTIFGEPGCIYWYVVAERGPNFEVEPRKIDVNIKGDINSPYRWI